MGPEGKKEKMGNSHAEPQLPFGVQEKASERVQGDCSS